MSLPRQSSSVNFLNSVLIVLLTVLLFHSSTATAGFASSMMSALSSKPDPPLGVECSVCEDVVTTFKSTFACADSDVGDEDGSSSTDASDDIHCSFKCTMLCTGDEESCLKRRELCEKGQDGIDSSSSLYKYIWNVNTCNMDVVDACARLDKTKQFSLGFAPQCTETDWDILTSEECRDNVNCEEAKNGAVDDACFTCVWLFKSTPLFAGICEPKGVEQCDRFRKNMLEEEPITKELYEDDIPDPWAMPPWGRFGSLGGLVGGVSSMLGGHRLRRRRRLLEKEEKGERSTLTTLTPALTTLTPALTTTSLINVQTKMQVHVTPPPPFTKDDKRGIGALKLTPLKKSMMFPGNCMKLWRQMEASPSGQIFVRRESDVVKACKCMCQCPYTSAEWLELEPTCKNNIDPAVYPFVLEDELGRDCKKKRTKDQEKFEEEAEQALEGDDKKSLRL